MSRDRGALALVLHTHMPYVEGFGTWPFGEEWLWEAVASVYIPLLDVLEGAPVTVSLTPVLCDQLEAMRGEPGDRYLRFLREIRAPIHAEDSAGLDATGKPELAAELRRAAGDYVRADEEFERRGRDLLAAFAGAGHRAVDIHRDARGAAAARHRRRPAAAGGRRASRAHERRFGEGWTGGFWLPECAYEPGLERDLAEHGVRVFCVDQTDVHGLGALEHLEPVATETGPVAVPLDWQTVELVWGASGYPSHAALPRLPRPHAARPEAVDERRRAVRPRARARRWRASTPRDFVDAGRRAARRLRGRARPPGPRLLRARHRAARPLVVRGAGVARGACSPRRDGAGLELVTLPAGLDRVEPVERELAASTWGSPKDLSTWDSARVAEIAFAARGRRARDRRRRGAGRARARRSSAPRASCSRSSRATGRSCSRASWPPTTRSSACAGMPRSCARALAGSRLRAAAGPRAALTFAGARPGAARLAVTNMRPLILSWEYPPLIEGGLARHVRKLAENLADQGVEPHVLTRGHEESPAEEEVNGVLIHRVREPKRPRELGEFVTWIEHMNARHARGRRRAGGQVRVRRRARARLARRRRRRPPREAVPLSVRRHDPRDRVRPPPGLGREAPAVAHPRRRALDGEPRRARDHVLVVHARARGRHLRARGGARHGDPERDRPRRPRAGADLDDLRLRFAQPDEQLVLLVGRLVYEKGFQLALEALPGLIERVGKVRFLVAGSGTHEQELREQATALGLDEHGTFLGWIGDDVLHSLYRIADLTVVPSIYEPFGLVALEAMASGCPCLVADTGGLREVVPNEDVGLRFEARDPESLAADGRAAADRRRSCATGWSPRRPSTC